MPVFQDSARYRCYHCHHLCGSPRDTVCHEVECHPKENLIILRPIVKDFRVTYKAVHFELLCGSIPNPASVVVGDEQQKMTVAVPNASGTSYKVKKSTKPLTFTQRLLVKLGNPMLLALSCPSVIPSQFVGLTDYFNVVGKTASQQFHTTKQLKLQSYKLTVLVFSGLWLACVRCSSSSVLFNFIWRVIYNSIASFMQWALLVIILIRHEIKISQFVI